MTTPPHRLHQLFGAHRDGTISSAEHAELQASLRADASVRRRWFLHQDVDDGLHDLVAASAVTVNLPTAAMATTSTCRPQRRLLTVAAACVALLGLTALWWSQPGVLVEVVEVSVGVSADWIPGRRLNIEHLQLVRGDLQLKLPSGVVLDVHAPVEMRLVDAMNVRILVGKVTADVGERGKGFVIETPQARVVDLGTRFGVDASDTTHTDVVVFQGQVELYQAGAKERVALLNQGEALRIENHRRTSRIVNVSGSEEAGDWSTTGQFADESIITSVRDSMSTDDEGAKLWPSLRSFYRIVPSGLRDGALAFSDQVDCWSDVPAELIGADQVRTFAIDSHNWWMVLTVELSRPSELFVFVDQRSPVTQWVRERFTDTGKTLFLDVMPKPAQGQVVKRLPYSIWRCVIEKPGAVSLGAPYENPPADRKSFHPNRMFGVAAKALP